MPVPQISPAILFTRLLPILLKLFPELEPVVGRIIPIFDVNPANDTELARQLAQKLKTPNRRGFNDATAVIKLSDVKSCIDGNLGDGKALLDFLKGLVNMLKGTLDKPGPQIFASRIMECCREKALRQDTPRKWSRSARYHRPSRGHGYGRSIRQRHNF